MKQIILSFAAVAVLAGCSTSYTHYQKNEVYTQDGYNCVVESAEEGVVNRTNTDKTNSTTYPNTACAELLNKKPAAEEPAATKVILAEQPTTTTIRSVKRIYLRNNCKASYGTWCE
jgi:uncharacterized lipoprotein